MDSFFGLERSTAPEDLICIATLHGPIAPAMAEEALTDAEIPFLKKERGSGTAVRILAGFQMFGTDFYVRPADEARARELFAALFAAEGETDGDFDGETPDGDDIPDENP